MKRIIKWICYPILAFGLYVVVVISYATITDWQPAPVIEVSSRGDSDPVPDSTFTFITWNIGFGALGEETSFFYDGGDTVIQEDSIVQKNMAGITEVLARFSEADVLFLQEVDSCAKRSHRRNQVDFLKHELPGFNSIFCLNYNVNFVPLPFTEPMGEVRSGLLTLCKYESISSQRRGFDTEFKWPKKVFFLDRCFLKQHIDLLNGKQLILINTHCSAYDTTGELVRRQVDTILEFAESEYEKGNYVVIGGDWNQCPPNYAPTVTNGSFNEFVLQMDQIPENWLWVADPSTPTNRKLNQVYDAKTSYTSVIDHYMVSPNVQVDFIKTHDTNFQFSDHQPVEMRVTLK